MRARPISMTSLIEEIAATLIDRSDQRQRVAIDGAEALGPDALAAALADVLRGHGRAAVPVSMGDFLLPASQRFEFGKTSDESFYLGWRDERGLRREVLDPAAPTGSGRVLPALWRADIDRSARAEYIAVPAGGLVIVGGQFLLGSGLPFDFTVHLDCSAAGRFRPTTGTPRRSTPRRSRMWSCAWKIHAAPPSSRRRPGQNGRTSSIAARSAGSSGVVPGRNRPTISPAGETRNFSKFH